MIEIVMMITLMMQCGLIGFSASCIAGGLEPVVLAIHVACIAANVLFGLVNVRNMSR